MQAARRALGKLYWWLFTLPSQYQLNHLSLAKAGAFETLQPTLHGAGLLGHSLCSMGFEPFTPGISLEVSRPALHRLSRTPCPLAGVLATPSVWFGVSEAEPCALGFAWSVLTSPHNIEASRVGAIPFPRSLPPSFSIPVKKGGGGPCLRLLPVCAAPTATRCAWMLKTLSHPLSTNQIRLKQHSLNHI